MISIPVWAFILLVFLSSPFIALIILLIICGILNLIDYVKRIF